MYSLGVRLNPGLGPGSGKSCLLTPIGNAVPNHLKLRKCASQKLSCNNMTPVKSNPGCLYAKPYHTSFSPVNEGQKSKNRNNNME
ncbi:hypothetical protein AVEN_161846-1 [Araneus ventricosus]|uniref:Uncharacterized protein n=1 Tax=Araneus ventricosus TaxID=182803 RepID=A0A4Y2IK42_ARAVE|nr:hypothetical protein AVEN_161846-1 [Araneus ventricosus]